MRMLWWNSQLVAGSNGPVRWLESESGIGYPERNVVVERLGHPAINKYRGESVEDRVYVATVDITPYPETDAQWAVERDQWEYWHRDGLGECELKRLTAANEILTIQAVARHPQWGRRQGHAQTVTQAYVCAQPYWSAESESSASGNFSGSSSVNISCANAGNMAAWPRIVITGVVNTPKIANSDGDEIEIDIDMTDANDQLEIICIPSSKIWFTPNGGSETSYLGYHTEATDFWQLPIGTNNVVISATSGTALCTIYWHNLYGAKA